MARPPSILRPLWAATLVYNLFVILFGAWVRITKSGDGCGQHWPTCHGEVLHLPQSVETLIELTHRVTSGLSLLLVIGLGVWTVRQHPKPHPARAAARWSMLFIVGEALVGAAIVLLGKVGGDSSIGRAVIMAVHLVNTCLLTFSLLFAAWCGGRTAPLLVWRAPRMRVGWVGAALLLLVSAAGAVTALGDTLFPVAEQAHAATLAASTDSTGHFLERVRGFHPLLASAAAVYLLWGAPRLGGKSGARAVASGLVYLQVALGIANVWLSAPGWMQIVHLGVANALWLSWVWLLLETAEGESTRMSPA